MVDPGPPGHDPGCDTPYSALEGAAARCDVAAAKAEPAASGHKGEPAISLNVAGSISETAGRVLEQAMKEAGFNVQPQQMDWGTVLARRARKDGWSMFPVCSNATDMLNPPTHFHVAATCGDFPGWSCDNRIPALLEQFTRADGLDAQKKLAAGIQKLSYGLTPAVMWGQFTRPAGYRTTLKNFIESSHPMSWRVEKAQSHRIRPGGGCSCPAQTAHCDLERRRPAGQAGGRRACARRPPRS